MAVVWENEIRGLLGENRLRTDAANLEKLSKDFYWYSPVLNKRLKGKLADCIVMPEKEEEVCKLLELAYRRRIPVTVRGAGTGNYGQAVPLNGGIVLDMSGLNKIVEIGEGYARVQAGVRLGLLDRKAREVGQELRIYPSTYVKATAGGFVCGGSGGIGSITWGNLWDGNVLEATVYTMEEIPRRLVASGGELIDYIHNYGTTGVMTELVLPLAPRKEWMQAIVHFDDFVTAVRFGEALGADDTIVKKLVSPMEWPIPSYFKPLADVLEPNAAAVLLEIEESSKGALSRLAESFGGRIGHVIGAERYHKGMGLSDFTWNHTTLWALKSDRTVTYLQAGFSPDRYVEQIREIKKEFGDEVLLHFEWMRSGGRLTPASLPIVRYRSEKRLYDIIRFFESAGVHIFDPHTWVLDHGGRGEVESMQRRKKFNDPLGLLNPGKMGCGPQYEHPV